MTLVAISTTDTLKDVYVLQGRCLLTCKKAVEQLKTCVTDLKAHADYAGNASTQEKADIDALQTELNSLTELV